jgi:sugar lactone lactonase YvrE
MDDIRRVADTRDTLGESPVWCPREQALYWVDVRRPALHRLDHPTGHVDSWPMPELVGSLALREGGGVLLAMRSGLSLFDPETLLFELVAALDGGGRPMRFNDGKCDRQGRFWAGTQDDATRGPVGTLYRYDPGRGCVPFAAGLSIPNGLCWSPDGRTMYFADSTAGTLDAFAYDPATGEPGARRVLVRLDPPAKLDGATVDAEGYIWCAQYRGWNVTRYAPDGRVDRVVELPVQQPTSCQLGGPDFQTLFVTTATQRLSAAELAGQPLAGAVLAVDVGVKGLPEPRFRG